MVLPLLWAEVRLFPGDKHTMLIARIARLAIIAALLLGSTTALAQSDRSQGWRREETRSWWWNWRRDRHHRPHKPPHKTPVPEFDPAAAGAVAALLSGGGLLIASRRKAK